MLHYAWLIVRAILLWEVVRGVLLNIASDATGTRCRRCRFRILSYKVGVWVSQKLHRFGPRFSVPPFIAGAVIGNYDLLLLAFKEIRKRRFQ